MFKCVLPPALHTLLVFCYPRFIDYVLMLTLLPDVLALLAVVYDLPTLLPTYCRICCSLLLKPLWCSLEGLLLHALINDSCCTLAARNCCSLRTTIVVHCSLHTTVLELLPLLLEVVCSLLPCNFNFFLLGRSISKAKLMARRTTYFLFGMMNG